MRRETSETTIQLTLELEPDMVSRGGCDTGVPFFDHVLDSLAFHGEFGLRVEARGDLQVDAHHLVEDVGLCLGRALAAAVGEGHGISRFGHEFVPMDDALVGVFVDLGGRPYLEYGLNLPAREFGGFHTDLVEEFLRALTVSAAMNLHVKQEAGRNAHHVTEACFKALGRALARAVKMDRRNSDAPSTKGSL